MKPFRTIEEKTRVGLKSWLPGRVSKNYRDGYDQIKWDKPKEKRDE